MPNTLRPWRVITHHHDKEHEQQHTIVHTYTAYELALSAYRSGLTEVHKRRIVAVELLDPSNRTVFHSDYGAIGGDAMEPTDQWPEDAAPGRYAYNEQADRFERIGGLP